MSRSADFFITYSNPNSKEVSKLEWLGSIPREFKPFDIDSRVGKLSPAAYRAFVREYISNQNNGLFGSEDWPWKKNEKAVFQFIYYVKLNKIVIRINNPNK